MIILVDNLSCKQYTFIMENKKVYFNIKTICQIAIFSALLCIMAQIAIPMPVGVPFTLQTLGIMLAGIILGTRKGTVAVLIYVFMGMAGLPVFANFNSGLPTILGPTGGFIMAFPVAALIIGLSFYKNKISLLILGIILSLILIYFLGILRFCVVLNSDPLSAVIIFLPYLVLDVVKAALAIVFGIKIKTALKKAKLL